MVYKCKENKEKTCNILNKELGSCEICEDFDVVWRCPNYVEEKSEVGK